MTDLIEEAAALAVPGGGLAARAVKYAIWGACGLAAFGLALWLIWWLFFSGHEAQQKHEIAAAHAAAEVGKAEGNAGAAAANTVANGAARETIIHERTNTNYVEITKQPGAGDPVSDAVDGAGRRSICLRASAAGLPDCQRLREANPQ